MRRDDAATENCRLQCRPNVDETEMSSTVSEKQNSDIDMSVMCDGSELQMAGPA